MSNIPIEQALFRRTGGESPKMLSHSPGFRPEWQKDAQGLMEGFGERPFGVRCPLAVFAQPFGKNHVAIIQVADGEAETPGLDFRFLILLRADYENYFCDPFYLADQFPIPEGRGGELQTLEIPRVPIQPRTVQEVQEVLKRMKSPLSEDEDPSRIPASAPSAENSQGPALLGGVQVLVDGGKVVFERPSPDPSLIRGLWTLLPHANRSQLWPASFAFDNALQFDLLVVPRIRGDLYEGYTNEDQAADYPPGHYEYQLQYAAEAGDQNEINRLFSRRSFAQTWRLAVILLVFLSALVLASRFLLLEPNPSARKPDRFGIRQRASAAAAAVAVNDPWTSLALIRFGNDLAKQNSGDGRAD